jgi:hypothetical protein
MVSFLIEFLQEEKDFLLADHCNYNHNTSNQRQTPHIPLSTGRNLGVFSKIISLLLAHLSSYRL